MKIRVKPLIISLLIPLAVGGLSALLTRNSMEAFGALNQPPLSPPGWLFPVVWTVLYLLMGFASYLVFVNGRNRRKVQNALFVYGVQLFFNFLWSIIFFNQERYFFAFFWLLALWVLILITLVLFYRIHKPAGLLLIPYLVWVTFAGYLNLGIALLN
ncbi:MAG: tryptophan-rich sensory protein [Clostridia bacterium]|nr:tryptophan-rich sensory protein [Clostridia bacterium]